MTPVFGTKVMEKSIKPLAGQGHIVTKERKVGAMRKIKSVLSQYF